MKSVVVYLQPEGSGVSAHRHRIVAQTNDNESLSHPRTNYVIEMTEGLDAMGDECWVAIDEKCAKTALIDYVRQLTAAVEALTSVA